MPHAAGCADAWAPIRSYTTRCHIETLKMSKWVWQGQPEAVKVGHFYLLTPFTAMSVPEAARRPRYGSYCRTVVLCAELPTQVELT